MLTLMMFDVESITVAGFKSHSCRPSPNLVPSEGRQRMFMAIHLLYLPKMHMAQRGMVKSAANTMRTVEASVSRNTNEFDRVLPSSEPSRRTSLKRT